MHDFQSLEGMLGATRSANYSCLNSKQINRHNEKSIESALYHRKKHYRPKWLLSLLANKKLKKIFYSKRNIYYWRRNYNWQQAVIWKSCERDHCQTSWNGYIFDVVWRKRPTPDILQSRAEWKISCKLVTWNGDRNSETSSQAKR